jgi:phosphohistidine phosphatase
MKTLHLLRHAKSDWSGPEVADRDRVLNARGEGDAPRMGAALAQRLQPMVLSASPARRAQLTLAGVCVGWPAIAGLPHRTEEALYTFSVRDLLAWLERQADTEASLFLVGHNPGLTDLVNYLAPAAGLVNLPTAGYVQLHLPIEHWWEVRGCRGSVALQLFPRNLG